MKMDIFTLLNFWKSNKSKIATETLTNSLISDPFTDEDDFFELELTFPNSDSKFSRIEQNPKNPSSKTPQSPITVLHSSSPKIRDFMIGKLHRNTHKHDLSETESDLSSNMSPRRSSSNSNLFTVKFRIEDGSIVPKFSRCNSSSLVSPNRSSDESNESSSRFSKDFIQKYLTMMKLSFMKSSKRGETEKFAASPASVPSPRKEGEDKQSSRFKVKCKKLGKSKSAPSMIVSPSLLRFPARNDHPVDGIEGAILYCKRSFNSTGVSSLSRCSSDPSHEKSTKMSEKI